MRYEIYTDGSTKNNGHDGAVGGYAFLIISNAGGYCEHTQAVPDTTNQRMELTAAIKALRTLNPVSSPDEYIIYSDSAYLINCYKQKWYVNWQKNGWVNSKKQPVANQDLWEQLIPYFECPHISWEKVKGHAGDKYNERVDELAQGVAAEYIKEYK